MKRFIDFIIEGLASPEQQSVQRGIEQFHNDAIGSLLGAKGYKENLDALHPNHLEPGQFKFFNPSADDTIRGDLHVNHEGTIISIECKGKNPNRPKHKTGVHQNDYVVRPDTLIGLSTPEELANKYGGEDLQKKQRVRASKILSDRKLKRSRSQLLPKEAEQKGRIAARKIIARVGLIPKMFKSIGSDVTISGSKHGVAVIPHIPHVKGTKKNKKRKTIERFLKTIGLDITHEVDKLTTAGFPEFRSDRRNRGIIRIGGINSTDKSLSNGQILYPQ